MKLTLLELVQDILSSMESDEVSSISDTVESLECAYTVRGVFFDLVEQRLIPELRRLDKLTALSDSSTPNYLQVPDRIGEIEWIRYNIKADEDDDDQFADVKYLTPEAFINLVNGRKSTDSNVVEVPDLGNDVVLLIADDKAPQFYTSFDDKYLCFDSYDADMDSSLQESKSQVYGKYNITWYMEDTFTPPIDDSLFPLLLSEARATCFINQKQIVNHKAEQSAKSHKARMHNKKHKMLDANLKPMGLDYGRK
jgi:hypothetical protein